VKFLQLGLQCFIFTVAYDLRGCLQQYLTHVELCLVLEREVAGEVERALLELLVLVGFAETDELLDEVLEVLVEGV